jgi:hypothetical protein
MSVKCEHCGMEVTKDHSLKVWRDKNGYTKCPNSTGGKKAVRLTPHEPKQGESVETDVVACINRAYEELKKSLKNNDRETTIYWASSLDKWCETLVHDVLVG